MILRLCELVLPPICIAQVMPAPLWHCYSQLREPGYCDCRSWKIYTHCRNLHCVQGIKCTLHSIVVRGPVRWLGALSMRYIIAQAIAYYAMLNRQIAVYRTLRKYR